MRSAFGSSYILRGRKGEQTRRRALIARSSPTARGFACVVRCMHAVIAGLTRNPRRAGDTVVIGAWIAGQARNDRCHAGLDPASTQRQNKGHPQSRAWADCSSQSAQVTRWHRRVPRGRHDREERSARARLCREACTSDGRLNRSYSGQQWDSTWHPCLEQGPCPPPAGRHRGTIAHEKDIPAARRGQEPRSGA